MQEQVISFETAKLAKSKGWTSNGSEYGYSTYREKIHRPSLDKHGILYLDAPTQSLIQKWLREVHNLIVIIDWGPLSEKYSYEIYYNGKNHDGEYVNGIYEEALEDGLIEALKLI